jgi:putative Mg2+ transporter-C (MgtC) family protein
VVHLLQTTWQRTDIDVGMPAGRTVPARVNAEPRTTQSGTRLGLSDRAGTRGKAHCCWRDWRPDWVRALGHHKPIGIAGMVMVALGSTTYMLLAGSLMEADPSSISRTLQGFLSGIGFLGGAVIFKSGFDVKGIKAAAAVWITGAVGLAIATSHWLLGITVGLVTALVMFVADRFPDPVRTEKQEPKPRPDRE